jgi:excisionase family DNA binding protein
MQALFYTSEQVASILQLKERTVQALARTGRLPGALKVGNQWRFNREKLDKWLSIAPSRPIWPIDRSEMARPKLNQESLDRLARIRALYGRSGSASRR